MKVKKIILAMVSTLILSIVAFGQTAYATSSLPAVTVQLVSLKDSNYSKTGEYQYSISRSTTQGDGNGIIINRIGQKNGNGYSRIYDAYCARADKGFENRSTTVYETGDSATIDTYNAKINMVTQKSQIDTAILETMNTNVDTGVTAYDAMLQLTNLLYLEEDSYTTYKNGILKEALIGAHIFSEANYSEVEDADLLTADQVRAIQQAALWRFTNCDNSFYTLSNIGSDIHVKLPSGEKTLSEAYMTVDGDDFIGNEANALYNYLITKSIANAKAGKAIDNDVYLYTNTDASQKANTQPIIMIKKVNKTFDLALRKYISSVTTNGTTTNYTASGERMPNVDPSTLSTGTTATYKHRKDPVVVETGSKVNYRLVIYNEGDVDGRATKVVDQLPAGLKFLSVVSGNFESDGTYTTTNNKLTLVRKSGNKTDLAAYTSGTPKNEVIEIQCQVTANPDEDNDKILTNIAWIAAHASNQGTYTDRDSNRNGNTPTIPSLVTTDNGYTNNDSTALTNKDHYFKGQEDDDDFEKIKIKAVKGSYNIVLVKEDKNGEDLNSTATFEVDGVAKQVTGRLTIVSNKKINASNVDTVDTYTIIERVPPDKYCPFDGTIKIEVYKKKDGDKYVVDKIKYYVDNVEVTSDRDDLKVSVNTNGNIYVEVKDYQFDLALRKYISSVTTNGTTTNYTASGERMPNVDPSTLSTGTTATYKHRKDPVVVETGSKVNYRLVIYNEGDVDGRATKVVDQLPAGLKFLSVVSGNFESDGTYTTTNNKLTLVRKSGNKTDLAAYTSGTPKNEVIEIQCQVTAEADTKNDKIYTNIAWIADHITGKGSSAKKYEDRDSVQNQPLSTLPSLVTTAVGYTGLETITTENGLATSTKYYKGQEDDDDFEKIKIVHKEFDLALRKFITKIQSGNTTTEYTAEGNRVPKITGEQVVKNTETGAKETTTAEKEHKKDKLPVAKGDIVTYTIRIYNEGQRAGTAAEVTDYLPEGLSLVPKAQSTINTTYNWVEGTDDNGKAIITSTYLKGKTIQPANDDFSKLKTEGYFKDLEVECYVNEDATKDNLKNVAAITKYEDENGKEITDRDSDKNPVNPGEYNPKNPTKGLGEQDDDDFEDLQLQELDLALRKFITRVAKTEDMAEAEEYNRAPSVKNINLIGTKDSNGNVITTASYNHTKDPVKVTTGDFVEYELRVYNEGTMDAYAKEVTDYLPEYLKFVDCEANTETYKWKVSEDGRTITTNYLADTKLTAVKVNDNYVVTSTSLDSSDKHNKSLKVICEVVEEIPYETYQTNIAQISKYGDKNENLLDEDRDSQTIGDGFVKVDDKDLPDYKGDSSNKEKLDDSNYYYKGQQDDDDFEKVWIPKFDLALRKFITKVESQDGKDRYTQSDYDERVPKISQESYEKLKNGETTTLEYTHSKETMDTVNTDIVTYTLRIYNEGNESGFASVITDDIPDGVEFLPDNKTNKEYGWVMYAELPSGVDAVDPSQVVELNINGENEVKKYIVTTDPKSAKIVRTDYLSFENGEKIKEEKQLEENPNLIKALDLENGLSDTNPDYRDIKVAFRVIEPNGSDRILINYAQISEDEDEDGKPVKDIDSTPDRWNEGEDDQDIEKIRVPQFDLALRKWVTQAIVTENGKTTVTETGHDAWDDPEEIVKVELHRKKLSNVTVKFRYSIRVYNQGEIEGYAKEVTDYIPAGLKFVAEDNPDWKDEGNNVISTRKLENTLLKPGEFADVEVLLTWINGNDNLGLKVNTAEISEDENEWGVPDKDSTPDNQKPGEDDIDDAPVMLSVSTGVEATYIILGLSVLITIAGGVALIKKYVM